MSNPDLYSLDAYDYELPKELIAQHPCSPRDHSRLLVVDRQTQSFSECRFADLIHRVEEGDRFIFNDTRVIPARLIGTRHTGGKAEAFLVQEVGERIWEALVRPAKKLQEGDRIQFGPDFAARIVRCLDHGVRYLQFEFQGSFVENLERYGRVPLPPYIRKGEQALSDQENYQTVYAKHAGAVAAPTAGLHFTDHLLSNLAAKGVQNTHVTLHVGLGTFAPIHVPDIRQHSMHCEKFHISEKAAHEINTQPADRLSICVGTTSCRALESAADSSGLLKHGNYDTSIFIYPGYQFKAVRALLTNFHLPKSTLLMLVSAFGGYELMREAYKKAVKDRYRFFSYGDAMLIL